MNIVSDGRGSRVSALKSKMLVGTVIIIVRQRVYIEGIGERICT